MPVMWCLANPKLGEREVIAALLERDHHLVRDGQVILADKGFAGATSKPFLDDQLGVHLVRPDRKDETQPGHGDLAAHAPVDRVGLRHPQRPARPRTTRRPHPAGVYARVAQRLLAMAAGIWHNWTTGAPSKRSLIAYDH